MVRVFLNDASEYLEAFRDETVTPSCIRLKHIVQGVVAFDDSNRENIRLCLSSAIRILKRTQRGTSTQ